MLTDKLFKRIKRNVPNKVKLLSKKCLFKTPDFLTSDEYAQKFNSRWIKVYEALPDIPPPVNIRGTLDVEIHKPTLSDIPGDGVLELSNALLFGRHGWIFGQKGLLLIDHTIDHGNSELTLERRRSPRLLPRGKRLNGVGLTIASDHGSHYGHWLLESIPRLHLFRQAGFSYSDVDYIFCSKPSVGTPQNLFEQLHIPENKCVWVDSKTAFRIDTLIAPSCPAIWNYSVKWVPSFLQREFLNFPSVPPSRRLYLSRAGYSRNPANSKDVNDILARHGFETFNPENHPASHRVLSEAAIVVVPTGSALAGLVFCKPGTRVLELIPTNMAWASSKYLCDAAGLDYSCIFCQTVDERVSPVLGNSPSLVGRPGDFYVDEVELDQAMIQLVKEL